MKDPDATHALCIPECVGNVVTPYCLGIMQNTLSNFKAFIMCLALNLLIVVAHLVG